MILIQFQISFNIVNYPSKTSIINSIKYPQLIKDQFLGRGKITLNPTGKPNCWAGGFSMVFQINVDGELWAFKVWHTELKDNKVRYKTVAETLKKCKLPYFADFYYVENGMMVDGTFLDTNRMRWLEGMPLKDYINLNIDNPKKLLDLASKFQLMVSDFHKNNIAHGDLQHGNIIVQEDGGLMVIDYDSMYVDNLINSPDLIKGLGGYQHPARYYNQTINNKIDYFSELIIYVSIVVYAEYPELWNPNTDWLLFSKEELENPETCLLFNKLKNSSNAKISLLINTLHEFLRCEDISQLTPLEDILNSKLSVAYPPINNITDKF